MTFPSFGDADTYAQLGRSCADAITGPGSVFDGCYHPIRPVGSAVLMALPYLATNDPVDAAYITLGLNVMFLAVVVACLAAALIDDGAVLAGHPRRASLLAGGAFAVLLPNLVPHLPVRLGDVPSLAAFMGALLVAVGTTLGSWTGRDHLRRYALCGALCALAVLVKVTYVVYAVILLASLLALDRSARGARLRCAVAFGIGLAPVALQALSLFGHTGQVGLYDREFMRTHFSYPRREYGIESVIFTNPENSVYLTQVAGGINRVEVLVLRLYRGLFGFEWAVYMGGPSRPPVWALTTAERVRAWALVVTYFAFSGWVVRKGTPALRLVTLNAAAGALATAALMHTELRYYALFRSVLWLTAALTLRAAFPRRAGGSSSTPPTG